jgi:hypothetical protein
LETRELESGKTVKLVLVKEYRDILLDDDKIRVYKIDNHTKEGAGYLASYISSPDAYHIYGAGENLFGLRPKPNHNVTIEEALEAAKEDWGIEDEEMLQENPFNILLEELDKRMNKETQV